MLKRNRNKGHAMAIDYLTYSPRLFTVADLAELPDDLPSGAVRYELDDGVLMTLPPLDFDHGYATCAMGAELSRQADKSGCGTVVSGGVGLVLRRDPDRVVGADVAFISRQRMPPQLSPENYLESMPDLVVEVVAKADTQAYLTRKTNDYLRAGVAIVWLVDPAKRTLVEHRPEREPVTYDESAIVELPELIPGFQLRLAEVFAD